MNVLIVFFCIAIFQGIVLGIIILKSPLFKNKANKYLAYAIFSLSVLLSVLILDATGTFNTIPILQLLQSMSVELAFPAFIFLFIAHQVKHPITLSKHRFWLFAPFLYTATLNVMTHPIVLGIPDAMRQIIIVLLLVELAVAIIFVPTILIIAYFFIKKSDHVQEKKWLMHFWISIFLIFTAFTLTIFLAIFLQFDIMPTMRVLALFAAILIHWVTYTGIYKFKLADNQKEIRKLIDKYKNPILAVEETPIRQTGIHKEKNLSNENVYFKKLETLCLEDKIYRDPSLDRDKVAELLGISPSYVSQIINTITQDNFSTFINHFRVEEVKQIMLNPEFENYSLLAIGLECGFSSKTTFHNSFKKMTGMTPNAYRKAQK